jgi:hypothetical protein
VGLQTYVWCARSKVCASVCALARKANPSQGGGAKPKGLLSSWEVAGLSNSGSGGATNLRPWERGEGADPTSLQT